MKKSYIYIIGLATALFTACEEVLENERILEVEAIEARRTVLLEDYTGQACINCPNAHKEALSLYNSPAYHDNLIIVAMHAGRQAMSSPLGLKQPEGDEYADKYEIKTYPIGMVNRRGGLKNYELWGAAIYEEIRRPSDFQLELQAVLTDGTIRVETIATALDIITDDVKLQLWILEDSIVGVQRQPDGSAVLDYVHNHVYRGSVNGIWGESVELSFGEPEYIVRDCAKAMDWVAENLSVVAFLYNDDSGVLQAAQCKLTINEPTTPEQPVIPDEPIVLTQSVR